MDSQPDEISPLVDDSSSKEENSSSKEDDSFEEDSSSKEDSSSEAVNSSNTAPVKESGCSGSVSGVTIGVAMLGVAAAALLRKKED